jgi:two-component system response regulator DegU
VLQKLMQIPPESCVKLAIVDDHTLFRQGLSYILRRMITCEVVIEVASGPELFAALPTVLPDVVLLDLHMQEMDGKEVSRRLLEQYPQIKIIILSMDYSPDFILELMRLGVHGYLPKDIDQRILKEAIEQVQTKGYYIDDTVAQVMREGLRNKKKSVSLTNGLLLTLTEREKEVLELLCQGLSSVQIAEKLFISLRTVEGHRKNLLEKTGASNAVSLAMFAMKHRMIEGF